MDDDKYDNIIKNLNTTLVIKHRCLNCSIEVTTNQKCSRCRTASYCCKNCQIKHWPVHKNSCQDANSNDTFEKKYIKAKNLIDQGYYQKAEKLTRKLLDHSITQHGEGHETVLELARLLAKALSGQRKENEAIEILYRFLRQQLPERENSCIIETQCTLAHIYNKIDNFDEAEAIVKACIEKTKKMGGDLIELETELGNTFNQAEKFKEAEKILKKIRDERRKRGVENQGYISTLEYLSVAYAGQSAYDESVKIMKLAIEMSQRIRGINHPETDRLQKLLSYIQERQSRLNSVANMLGIR